MAAKRTYRKAECVHCKQVKSIAAQGLCRACYMRRKRFGTLEYQRWGKVTVCRAAGCGRKAIARGLCDAHRVRGVPSQPLSQKTAAVQSREWRAKNKRLAWDKDLRKDFGIGVAEYEAMLAKQNRACAICKQPETFVHHQTKQVARLAVDHCHNNNRVRGLLCHKCNHGLGKFNDDIALLQRAIEYLQEH